MPNSQYHIFYPKKKTYSECGIMCYSLSYYSVNLGSTAIYTHWFTDSTCDNKLCKYQKDKYMFFYNSENVIYISFFLISQLLHSTLVVLALIILLEDMFKFSNNVFIKRKIKLWSKVERISNILENGFSFSMWNISK